MRNQKKYRTDIVNTVIGEDSTVKGGLLSQRSIRIEGSFEGEVNSQGEVYIGQKSKVKATLIAKHVVVGGEVIGNIEAIKSLHILKTGRVYGDIAGDELKIDEGGVYKGKVNMDIISAKNAYEGSFQLAKK